jgi:hypothetical protein
VDEEYQVLPHAKWMNADVLNSPHLTRLLDGLAIESSGLPEEIEPLHLSGFLAGPQRVTTGDIVTWSGLAVGPHQSDPTLLLDGSENRVLSEPLASNDRLTKGPATRGSN